MFPILHLGPLAIQTLGLILLLGIWVGLDLAGRRANWHGIESTRLDNLVMASLFGFVAGGRLAFVAINYSIFQSAPLDIFSLNYELFDLTGGLAAGLIIGWVYGSRNGFSLWLTLDALAPFAATIFVAIGIAHLASGAAYGESASVPWAIEMRGALRHPSQVYESLGAILILLAIGLRRPHANPGVLFLLFGSASAGMSLFLLAFRGDAAVTVGGFRLGQVAAWVILAAALALLDRRLHSPLPQLDKLNPSRGQ